MGVGRKRLGLREQFRARDPFARYGIHDVFQICGSDLRRSSDATITPDPRCSPVLRNRASTRHAAGALERGARARDPPIELLPGPLLLGRIRMNAQRMAEDPAVLDQAREHPELELLALDRIALRGAVVTLDLVMSRVDAPGVVAQVPGEL